MSKKLSIVLVIVALVVGIVFGAIFAPTSKNVGGLVNLTQEKFPAGLKAGVTDQFVISSAGVVTGTASTFTGISTLATTSVTSLCVYNGAQFTKITFSGVTPSYATSTTCL